MIVLDQKKIDEQQEINKLHHELFNIDVAIREATQQRQINLLEKDRVKLELRLMGLYGTEKYGLVN